jgi:hypothetical protein
VAFKPNAEFASVYHKVFGESSTQEELYGQVQGEAPRLDPGIKDRFLMANLTARFTPFLSAGNHCSSHP